MEGKAEKIIRWLWVMRRTKRRVYEGHIEQRDDKGDVDVYMHTACEPVLSVCLLKSMVKNELERKYFNDECSGLQATTIRKYNVHS